MPDPPASRLVEAINKKVITNALLTTKYCSSPVASTCRFKFPQYMGSQIPCTAPIDTPVLHAVVEIVNTLHEHLGDQCIDDHSTFTILEFRSSVATVASSMLCPMHNHRDTMTELLHTYFEALMKASTNELHTMTDLAEKSRTAQINQILTSIGKTPRTSAERAAHAKGKAGRMPAPPLSNDHGHQYFRADASADYDAQWARSSKRRRGDIPSPPLSRARMPAPEPSLGAWKHAIERYEAAWAEDACNRTVAAAPDKHLTELLVFPCLTGRAKDLDEMNVARFYEAVTVEKQTAAVKFFRDELLIWHPDRIDLKFTGALGKDDMKPLAAMVFRMANVAMDKAKHASTGAF